MIRINGAAGRLSPITSNSAEGTASETAWATAGPLSDLRGHQNGTATGLEGVALFFSGEHCDAGLCRVDAVSSQDVTIGWFRDGR